MATTVAGTTAAATTGAAQRPGNSIRRAERITWRLVARGRLVIAWQLPSPELPLRPLQVPQLPQPELPLRPLLLTPLQVPQLPLPSRRHPLRTLSEDPVL